MAAEIGWKVWLTDGTTMSSKEDNWVDVPHQIQFMYRYYDDGVKRQVSGNEIYCRKEDEAAIATGTPTPNTIKCGEEMTDQDAFHAIIDEGIADTETFV